MLSLYTLGTASLTQDIHECDTIKHLGILRLVNPFSARILDHCIAGRGAYSLPLAPHAGGVHPLTAYHLDSSICLPILIYGSELWGISSQQFLECVHRKILHAILGLAIHCCVSSLLRLSLLL